MPSCRVHRIIAVVAFLALRGVPAPAQPLMDDKALKIAGASDDGARAIAKFRVPKGFKVELFAAEPMLANPVAIALDEKDRVYVAETFRVYHGVTDNRRHGDWIDEDLAARTVEDRVAMYRKHEGKNFAKYGVEPDRIRLLEDRDGDGKADHSTVFADGFNKPEDGIGSGVLARGGDVYYTCIPDLWLLRDTDGDGKADVRKSLAHGFGVHVAFLGHDMHGLRFGPDGRLYFSIGDRALNVKTAEGRTLVNLESGSILRCEPDGSGLEIFATGLRNPQELAFNNQGDLFTGDNNSDSGDRARLVHVVEGGDSGWRFSFQYIEHPVSRGPWNAEKLWYPHFEGQAAYILPPVANLASGPSGLTFDPGTGLPERYRDHFFLCDFRGSGGASGVRSFEARLKGATYQLADSQEFFWSVLATDADFGADGALYVSDWVEGWDQPGKGRIYRLYDPEAVRSKDAREARALIAEGMGRRSVDELTKLLGHPDRRVRQEAQFAIAAKGAGAARTLDAVATDKSRPMARLHAIWAIGQVGRKSPEQLKAVFPLFADSDPEVRAQAVRVACDASWPESERKAVSEKIATLLRDESPRVRMFAAIGLGRIGAKGAVDPLLALLRKDGQDPILRHAAVMGLVGSGDQAAIVKAASDQSPSVRMGVLLALRRLGRPEVGRFLADRDSAIVVEAARAIHDAPIEPARPALAAMLDKPGMTEPLLKRAIDANLRVGGPEAAARLARFAGASSAPEGARAEAIEALASWTKPPGRDRVLGLWRPVAPHPASEVASTLKQALPEALASGPDAVRRAAAKAAGDLEIKSAGPALLALAIDPKHPGETRAEAIKALDALGDPGLPEAVMAAVKAKDAKVRVVGQRLLAKLKPDEAVKLLESVLVSGDLAERQGALAVLGDLKRREADVLLGRWLDKLQAGKVPADMQLDLLDAAGKRKDAKVQEKLAHHESSRSKGDPVAPYSEALAGGDAERGRKIFLAKAEVECVRCHRVRKETGEGFGGDVGPDLTNVGSREPRAYILESIVAPNAKIAKGFETVVLALSDGRTVAGIVKSDDGKTLKLQPPQGPAIEVQAADIDDRKTGLSGMPEDLVKHLSKSEVRDLVEFLSTMK